MINSPFSKSSKHFIIPEDKSKKKITLNKIFKTLNKRGLKEQFKKKKY